MVLPDAAVRGVHTRTNKIIGDAIADEGPRKWQSSRIESKQHWSGWRCRVLYAFNRALRLFKTGGTP